MKDFILVTGASGMIEYEYEKPEKELFYSWVFANGLR